MTERLQAIAADLQLELTTTQCAQLSGYAELLVRWNRVHNLTSIRDPDRILTHHLLDCLAAVPPLRRQGDERGGWKRLLDVGSGAGLPGLVFAVMQPETDVVCVDSVGKKTAFVAHAAAELGARNVSVIHDRAERLRSGDFDLICSRAFASLDTFVSSTAGALTEHGIWLAMKGHNPAKEIQAAQEHADVFHVEPLDVPGTMGARCLVWVRKRWTSA